MDVEMRPVDGDQWKIVDLLGRKAGSVSVSGTSYVVVSAGTRLVDMDPGPFPSLDAACVAIGAKLRGRCRLVPSGDAE